MSIDREVSHETESMRRARPWLTEEMEAAALVGKSLDDQTVRWFTHIAGCHDCELREHNDPDLCDIATTSRRRGGER